MKLPSQLRIFIVLLVSTYLIYSFSILGAKAVIGFNSSSFEENTSIGPIDVSHLEKSKAQQEIISAIDNWQSNTEFQILFKEVKNSLPIENFSFLVDESVQMAKDSTKNELLMSMDTQKLLIALTSLSPTLTEKNVDINKLKSDLLIKASQLETGIFEFNIENYYIQPVTKEQVVYSVSIPTDSMALKNLATTLVIEPKSNFSLVDALEKQELMPLDQRSMDELASGIYQTVLSTNFNIIERHIGSLLPTGIKLGYEAKVDSILKWDLTFYNPNEDAYKMNIYSDGQSLVIDLVGRPFIYQYSIEERDQQEYAPKKIKQFSPLLNSGQSVIKTPGQKGFYIEMVRVVKDETDAILEEEVISKDYYPPVHQVEINGLQGSTTDMPSTSEPVTNNDSSLQSTNETGDPQVDTSKDELWGKSDESEK